MKEDGQQRKDGRGLRPSNQHPSPQDPHPSYYTMRPSLVRWIRPAALPVRGQVDPRSVTSQTVPGFNHFVPACRRLEFEFHQNDIRGEGLRCVFSFFFLTSLSLLRVAGSGWLGGQ